MTSLTDIIADIRKAMERATPGPWAVEEKKFRGDYSVAWKPELKVCRTYGDSLSAECDATYIAACNPSNIAAVLDALEKAERDLSNTLEALQSLSYLGSVLSATEEKLSEAEQRERELLKALQEVVSAGHLRAARRFIEAHTGGEDAGN
jgi:hypothetical protein